MDVVGRCGRAARRMALEQGQSHRRAPRRRPRQSGSMSVQEMKSASCTPPLPTPAPSRWGGNLITPDKHDEISILHVLLRPEDMLSERKHMRLCVYVHVEYSAVRMQTRKMLQY